MIAGEYAEAGVTWWLEHLHGYRGDYPALLARVQAGPAVRRSVPKIIAVVA